jgi:hypothetical protein
LSQAYDLLNAVRDGKCASLNCARYWHRASRRLTRAALKDMEELGNESLDPDNLDDNVYQTL